MTMSGASRAAFALFSVALGVMAAGCAAGDDYRPPVETDLGIPPAYRGTEAQTLEARQLADWWRRFDDPALDALIARALFTNLDITQARLRLVQAREAAVQAGAAYAPRIDASLDGGRNLRMPGADGSRFSAGADASWEIDLFGGIGRSVEAARAAAESVEYDLASVRVAIIAETASNYIQLRQLQEQKRIARETLTIQDDNLQIAQWRVMAGLASVLDVEQARTQRAQTAASLPLLEESIRNTLARIAVLTGQAPGAATRLLETPGLIPMPPAVIAAGIPADTLRQRPDVRAAERALARQTALIGVSEAQLRPGLFISGNIGSTALRFGALGDIVTGGLFMGLRQLIFDGGAARSRVRAQRAAADGAFAAYRQNILTALEDVENGLVAVDATSERYAQLEIARDAASNSALLARDQYRAGLTDFSALLDAERSLLSSRNNEAAGRADRARAVVQLYRALGGGWQTMDDGIQND